MKSEINLEQLQNIFQNVPAATAIFRGHEHKYILANTAYEKVTNRKTADLLGQNLCEVFPELIATGTIELFDNVFKTGETFNAPEFATMLDLKNDGLLRQCYFNFSIDPLKNDSGEIFGVIAMFFNITEQVELRRKVEESERKFQAAILAVEGVIWTNNGLGEMEGEQPGWANLTGQRYEDYQGYGWAKTVHPDDAQPTVDAWNIAVANKSTFEFEHRLKTKQNGWTLFSIKAVPVFDDKGIIQQWIGVHTDISKQKETEEKIKESEKQQAYLLKLSDALRLLDNHVDIEEAATKIAMDFMDADRCYYCIIEEGNAIIERDAVRGDLPSIAGVYPISNNLLFKTLQDAGGPFIVEDVHTTTILDEELKQLCLQLQLISFINVPFTKNGKPVGVLSLLQSKPRKWTDIEMQLTIETAERTYAAIERAKAEQALRQSEEKYRNLFTSIDQGFALCELIRNKEGKGIDYYMLEGNSTYEEQSGVSMEMMLGKSLLSVFPAVDKWWIETYAAVVDNQRPAVFEKYFDITQRWFAVNAYPDNKDRFAILFNDITERKLYENELIEAKAVAENAAKSRQQFLSNMSHEIRTPLNSIIGFTNVLAKTKLGSEQKEFVEAINTSGKSLNLLINDILDLAKVDAGKMTFEKHPIEIRKSMTSILHSFDMKIKEKNLELAIEHDSKVPSVLLGDSLRLNQIFFNLLSNAIKFTHKGKIKLSIKLLHEDKENVTIEFVVSDSGIGIADNKLNSIFNLFEQAEINTSTSYGGSGLGLSIVKQLVEGQGGSVSVKSKLGEGSAFSFTLSFGKTNLKLEAENEILETASEIKTLRVLVAEDVALNQLLIKIILNDFGFEQDIVSNGKLAIEKMQTNTYDIILMDLQMPEMNGFEATEYIRKTLKSPIPIIALTADVTTTDISKCKEFGMDSYISKPIDEKLLYNKIVELVKKNK